MTPYRAKSIKSAERKVRALLRAVECREDVISLLRDDLLRSKKESELLAMLAAKGPAFDNPILAAQAEILRDKVLNRIGLNPDGTYIKAVK